MLTLPALLDHLAQVYGEPEPPPPRSLFELVLWENVAYLADDAAREHAFSAPRCVHRLASPPTTCWRPGAVPSFASAL